MSFGDHIRICNSYVSARAVPLMAGNHRLGLVRRDNAAALRAFADVFAVTDEKVVLTAEGDATEISRIVDRVVDGLVVEHRVPKYRNETFDVAARWGLSPVFRLDRGAVPFFGTRAYGVHLNGYRRDANRLSLWVARRAADRRLEPDKLDNLVAGGIGSGYGAADTLVKEAAEEAAIAPGLINRAVPAGAVSYRMETELGIRDDVLFLYDLEIPPDFVPENRDGEIADFALMPMAEVLDRIRSTADFKFNVNLVILDFAVRHGILRPDDTEYLEIATGLHRALD